MNKTVYRLTLTLRSPLAIASGANEHTDKDVILDSRGYPFIPATAIAGVLRSFVKSSGSVLVKDTKDHDVFVARDHALFGFIPTSKDEMGKPENMELPSLLRFYDAAFVGDSKDYFITNRDCVALENKVGVKGAKFDLQAVEPSAKFMGCIEILNDKYDVQAELERALAALDAGLLAFGGKTSRGYGQVSVTAQKRQFTDITAWLDFDMFAEECWEGIKPIKLRNVDAEYSRFEVRLKLISGISIREYTTNVDDADYRSLSLHNKVKTAVIPGTSWAGAFRDRYIELTGDDEGTRSLFGFVDQGTGATQKSRIIFSESNMTGGCAKKSTRNSVDRFSAKTKNGALYTENTHFYGSTTLCITIRNAKSEEVRAIGLCLLDLHYGFLAVGGLTSVGRGLFEIESVNGMPFVDFQKEVLG